MKISRKRGALARTLAGCVLLASPLVLAPHPARAEGQYVSTEGVPDGVEEMYRKGLRFLASTQKENGTFGSGGPYDTQPAVVGLSGLAFLAHGDDPNTGPYAKNIRQAVNFVLSQQKEDGYIGNSMYNHGFSTLFLAEAYGMVNDDRIGPALQKAVNLIADSQAKNAFGAWRYSPDSTDADTTVSGACFVALAAAANAGIRIPDKAYPSALKYYRLCMDRSGGVGYTAANGGNETLTAIGALCFTLAKDKKSPAYKKMIAFLEDAAGDNGNRGYADYTRYYKSQACFHGGTKMWDTFNEENIKELKASQAEAGGWEGPFGPTFSTAASLLSLALNYRFLPIYER